MKFVQQFDQMDCGPACIRMIASAYGKDYPLSYLRSLSHLTREGVSVTGIRHALREIGMESATFEMTLEQLREKYIYNVGTSGKVGAKFIIDYLINKEKK